VDLAEFNALPLARAEAALLDCCGSVRWANSVATQRPYTDLTALYKAGDAVWRSLDRADWLEAFGRHPQIGEKTASGSEASRRWAEGEQAGAQSAAENAIERLAEGNRAYREKFGYIFIVCATGKSANEMLAILGERLHNDPGRELHIAAEQQRLITRLRLEKLVAHKL
jgi:OHCU decarboxylase